MVTGAGVLHHDRCGSGDAERSNERSKQRQDQVDQLLGRVHFVDDSPHHLQERGDRLAWILDEVCENVAEHVECLARRFEQEGDQLADELFGSRDECSVR